MDHQTEVLYEKYLDRYSASMAEKAKKQRRSVFPSGRGGWDTAVQSHRETKDCPITDLGVMTTEDDLENFIRFGCL